MTTFLLMTLCMLPLAADIHAAEQEPVADGHALRTASLFCDNMVFQQNTSAAIWGWGEPGDTVSVTTSWDGRRYTAGIPTGGCDKWLVEVDTPDAGGPYRVDITSGKDTVTLKNVLVGEVWICSGQSNMAMPVRGYTGQPAAGAMQAVLEAPVYEDRIGIVNVAKDSSSVIREDCSGKWYKSSSSVVAKTSAVAYGFAVRLTEALGVPVGIVVSAYGGTKIEAWTPADALEASLEGVLSEREIEKKLAVRNTGRKKPDQAGTLYNAMISPLAPFAAKGFLWYQGCSNRRDYTHYDKMQTAMVSEWRKAWHDGNDDMLFAFVTIAPYSYGDSSDDTRAYFVENQLKSLETIPNSLAVVSEDSGEEFCIHPRHKDRVADRLAWNILVADYGFSGIPAGWPEAVRSEVHDGVVTIWFDNVKFGLCPTYGEPVKGFELAGRDRVFHEAEAVVKRDPFRVEVSSDMVKAPVAARYSFRNFIESNLTDLTGSPVPPFRTDDWSRE